MTEVKDSQAEVQMPVTPKPSDIKKLPIPVEVELPRVDAIPSPSDITPDFVEHPRCSSEQLFDNNNNNTVIHEIMSDETKLGVPFEIPNTPFNQSKDLMTPELITSANKAKISQTESAVRIPDEKTDLKSKVMEVNQDMEELRLSIERSLAELTCLDKPDVENVKKKQEDDEKIAEKPVQTVSYLPEVEQIPDLVRTDEICSMIKEHPAEEATIQEPICPERKDRKGKGKSKKKVNKKWLRAQPQSQRPLLQVLQLNLTKQINLRMRNKKLKNLNINLKQRKKKVNSNPVAQQKIKIAKPPSF